MPLPYQPPPRGLEEGRAAFLKVLSEPDSRLLAGLLVIDGLGRPIEFVHNHLELPPGPLWQCPPAGIATPALIHSLFDACREEPDLLVMHPGVGPAEFCREALAPAVPACFGHAVADGAAQWEWINRPPADGMRAALVASELPRRGFAVEPFERLRAALYEIYGEPDGP